VENLEANLRSRLAGLTEPWARAQREQAALKADNVLMWNAIRSLTRHDQEERQRLLPLWDDLSRRVSCIQSSRAWQAADDADSATRMPLEEFWRWGPAERDAFLSGEIDLPAHSD